MDRVAAVANAAFDHRLDRGSSAPLALALSGGGDSIALLHLAAAWTRARGRRLLALTVDHRLHPESASWTAFAGEAAARAGADWRPLDWTGAKPSAGLPAAARAVRHRLLSEAARSAGAKVLLTGHTADDVIEGEIMRLADVPGLGRLRDWAPSPAWPEGRGLFLLRPLLALRRADLRAWLAERGRPWLDDPANTDRRFSRARVRSALGEGGRPEPAVASRPPVAPPFETTPDGRIIVAREALAGAGSGHFVAAALLCAGGTAVPPRGEPLERLRARLGGSAPVGATLAGARVAADAATVQFGREAGERFRGGLTPLSLAPGRSVVWDGRFELTATEPGWTAAPLGGLIARLTLEDRRGLKPIPAWARGALPALTDAAGAVRLPSWSGEGPVSALALAGPRLAAACGLVEREGEMYGGRHGADRLVTLCSELRH